MDRARGQQALRHALPTVAAIRRQTDAEIHWAVHPAFAGLVRMFRCVDHIVEIPRHGDIADHRRTLRHLRENAYDIALDLQGLFKSALVTRLARASRRIGPPFHRELSRLFYNAAPRLVRPRRHAVEECLDVLPLLGLSRPETPEFPIQTPAIDLPKTDAIRVAIAPLSRWETKNWPLDRRLGARDRLGGSPFMGEFRIAPHVVHDRHRRHAPSGLSRRQALRR